jgi:hypothetical protein
MPTRALSNDRALTFTQPKRGGQAQTKKPIKRALLVGISLYLPTDAKAPQGNTTPATKPTTSAKKGVGRATFSNLDGPKTDVPAMKEVLEKKFGFTVVNELKDQNATRKEILAGINKYLIDDAAPGDVCLFYYSGHGSRVKNPKGGEADGLDETLVPADSYLGAMDIRDKELARLYLKAIEKGITLTVISDSCHSGSNARGDGYPTEERARELPDYTGKGANGYDPEVGEAPGYKDDPESKGLLVLSASQDNQQAKERRYDGLYRGNFTWALINVLNQPSVSANESAERIFQRVTGFMKGEGASHDPVLGGIQGRRRGPLFGKATDKVSSEAVVAVEKVEGSTVKLQGGFAIGLREDCELKKVFSDTKAKEIRLRVTEVKGPNSSAAAVINGNAADIKPADLFVIDQWVYQSNNDLMVYIPPAILGAELARFAQEIAALKKSNRVNIVDDPTEETPVYAIQYDGGTWNKLSSQGQSAIVGFAPTASSLVSAMPGKEKVFLNLPPSTALREAITLGSEKSRLAVKMAKTAADANYVLAGRVSGDRVEYAWVRPGVTTREKESGANPMPTRSDWVAMERDPDAVSAKLEEYAVTLSRIRGWQQIQPDSNTTFPYSLALRKTGTSDLIRAGNVKEGGAYDLVLVADKEVLKRLEEEGKSVTPRRVYVFIIDKKGNSTLLFNVKGNDAGNLFPSDANRDKPAAKQPEIIQLGDNGLIEISPPLGLDTYILLTSEEIISDPFILEFQGVSARGKGDDSAFSKLLYGIGTGSRAARAKGPRNWSIDRVYLRSVPKS